MQEALDYHLMSPQQKRIWHHLQWYCKKFSIAFPSHSRMAKACGCSRRTVLRAIQLFVKKGWLKIQQRYRQTCVYIMDKALQLLDFRKEGNNANPEIGACHIHCHTSIYTDGRSASLSYDEKDSIAQQVVDHPDFQVQKSRKAALWWYMRRPKKAMERLIHLIQGNEAKKIDRLPQAIFEALQAKHRNIAIHIGSNQRNLEICTPFGVRTLTRSDLMYKEWLASGLAELGINNQEITEIMSFVEEKLNGEVKS